MKRDDTKWNYSPKIIEPVSIRKTDVSRKYKKENNL